MADLGTKALLQADLDGKVTTNGANENTGLRVRTFLTNFIDTVYALIGRDLSPTATFSTNTNTAQDPGQDTFRLNNATIGSVTEIALSDVVGGVDKGDLNSRFSGIIQFREVGTTATAEFQINSVVHTSWTRYTVTYLKGTLPANGTVCAVRFLPSGPRAYIANISQSGTSAPTVDSVIMNTAGITPVFGYAGEGLYTVTSAGSFPSGKVVSQLLNPNDGDLSTFSAVAGAIRVDSDTINLIVVSFPGGLVVDGTLNNSQLVIHIYP